MFFKGSIMATSDDCMKPVQAGSFELFQLSISADDSMEHDVSEIEAGNKQIIEWLDSPGKFNTYVTYNSTHATAVIYKTEDMGYTYYLKITYYVTVETGV